eukprot:Skav208827  [mRNA]  locus=scaffold667:347014:354691:+ [translate_table: standard]
MFHLLNVLDYTGLGIFLMLLALMGPVPLLVPTVQIAPRIRKATLPMCAPIAYAFLRFQWFLSSQASLRKESPECEDKVLYYKNFRNTYLTFCLMFSGMMVLWVAHLKADRKD